MASTDYSEYSYVGFRWGREEEFDDQLPEGVARSEGLRRVLDEWLDSDRDLPESE
jgi:hypothetical protein